MSEKHNNSLEKAAIDYLNMWTSSTRTNESYYAFKDGARWMISRLIKELEEKDYLTDTASSILEEIRNNSNF